MLRQIFKRSLFTKKAHPPRELNAEEAVKIVKSGDRIYMHGVASFPFTLAEALSKRTDLENVEINHLHIERDNPCTGKPGFFIDNYFIGPNQRKAVASGQSTLIPCFLSELPKLMRMGIRTPDIAFLNVSVPDKHGFCSLGLEICTAYVSLIDLGGCGNCKDRNCSD